MPRKKSSKSSSGGTKAKPPPPLSEQMRLRRKDPSIVPSAPYLLASQILDFGCDLPLIRAACPSDGWRSALPPEWAEFPSGKLSHSVRGHFIGDPGVENYVTFDEFLGSRSGGGKAGGAAAPSALDGYYDYAFRTDSTVLNDPTHPLAMCVLLVLLLIIRVIKRICLPRFSALGRSLGRAAHGDDWEAENGERIVKFGEYVYRLIYHASVSAAGVWYFRNKSWWDDERGGTDNLWLGHPNQPVEPGMAWYYLVQGAYNLDALISLAEISFEVELVNPFAYSSALDFLEKEHVVDERQRKEQVFKMMAKSRRRTLLWTPLFHVKWSPGVRGDFREMMAHHLVTNALIFFSAYWRFTRIGSMIFLVHDISDVPIDMSKLANFVKWKITTIVCFVVMVLLWVVTRLTILPFVICKSVVLDSYRMLVTEGTMDPAMYELYHLLFYSLLGALVLLHVTWFLILLRIGYTLVSTGERHDYSEFKSGEKQKNS